METDVANKDDMLNATKKIHELIEKGIDDKFYESIDDLKYHLTYGRLSKKDVIDIKEAEAEYGDIVSVVIDLVKNTVKKDKTGVEGNEIAGNLGSVQKKEEKVCTNGKLDKFAREMRMQNVKREKLKMKKDSYIGNEVIDPAGYLDKESAIKSSYAAFWRRLRHMKSRRKSKSIVKVITETTLGDFETQLTKYTNDGYKIKYVNIDTKAGNSGSGVRYYAVVQRR